MKYRGSKGRKHPFEKTSVLWLELKMIGPTFVKELNDR